MFRRLREVFVQEVPEALTVCVFDCPVTRCTSSMWAECSHRSNAFPEWKVAVNLNIHTRHTEKPISVDEEFKSPTFT